jgi:hypothetical protein
MRGVGFEHRPVLIALVPVPDLGCVHDERQPRVGRQTTTGYRLAYRVIEVRQFLLKVKAMLEREQGTSGTKSVSLHTQALEVLGKTAVPFR